MVAVTVLIPARNAERTLGETLSSLEAQTYRDFEVLLVNDASTDRTLEVAQSFQGQAYIPEEIRKLEDSLADQYFKPEHPPMKTEGGTWERGGQNLFTTRLHKSETFDYGILLTGERILITDDGRRVLKPGDVVVQIGSWHAWTNPNDDSQMAFVMMGASFED